MRGAFFKSAVRSMRANAARLVAVSVIILLGVAFVAGLGTLSPTIERSFYDSMESAAFADLIVKSKSAAGFTKDEIARIRNSPAVASAEAYTVLELELLNKNARLYVLPESGANVGLPALVEGKLPESADEIAVERASDKVESYRLGDTLSFYGRTVTVVGVAANPLLFAREGEPSLLNGEPLELIAYLSVSALPVSLPATDVYCKLAGTEDLNAFSKKYASLVQSRLSSLREELDGDYAYLTLEENKSFLLLRSYCDKVDVITLIFPVFFLAVAALVALTTLSRMIEEERPQIACYQTLGVSGGRVIFKYVSIFSLCCLVASATGLAAGLPLLPAVIYPAFNAMFLMPPQSGFLQPLPGLAAAAGMLAVVAAVTLSVLVGALRGQPAQLLSPKAPKPGKKIFLERLPFLWKRLSFRYKSSLRNVFRRVSHLLMTVVSVAGSTALVFAGFALLDVSKGSDAGKFAGMGDSMSFISLVVIVFALLLCAFVIYNLTNMNVSERKREIATLKVLGYHDGEVTGYIYREVLIMALIGIGIGIGLGVLLIRFVLAYLEFGSLKDVAWYSYLASCLLVLVFVGAVDAVLAPKILAVDMTSSLKSVD